MSAMICGRRAIFVASSVPDSVLPVYVVLLPQGLHRVAEPPIEVAVARDALIHLISLSGGHRRRLRPCSEWPSGRGTPKQRDKFATFHSITSSAVASSEAGI